METNKTFMTIRCNRSFNEMKSSVLRLLQGKRDILLDKRISDEEDARFQNHAKRCNYLTLPYASDEPFVGETLHFVERMCEKGYALVYNRSWMDADTFVQFFIQHDVCHKLIHGLFKDNGKKVWQYATIVVPVSRFGKPSSLEWLKQSGFEYEMCKGNLYETAADFMQRRCKSEARFVSLFVDGKSSFYPGQINRFYRNEIIDGVKEGISIEDVEQASTFHELYDCIFIPQKRQTPDWVDAKKNKCFYGCAMFEPASTSPNNFLIKSCNTANMLSFIDKPLATVNKACKEGYAIARCGKERVKIGDTSIAEGMIDFFKKNNILHKMVCGCFVKDNEMTWGIAFVVTGENLEVLNESGYEYEAFSFEGSVDRNVDTFMEHHFGEDARYDGTYVNPWPASLSERLPRHFTHEIGMTTDITKPAKGDE